eukprot:3516240-Prymnesium_polylepis.2
MHRTGIEARVGQYEPRSHDAHAVAFSDFWYVPPAHGSHSDAPGAADTKPGMHGVGATAPTEHALPGGHCEHCSTAERSIASDATALPAGQKLPLLHISGTVHALPQTVGEDRKISPYRDGRHTGAANARATRFEGHRLTAAFWAQAGTPRAELVRGVVGRGE